MTTLTAYRVAPNSEHRAARELREAGIRAYVPRDRSTRRSPFTGKHATPSPGYVFAEKAYRPAFEKHVKGRVGAVAKADLGRLYLKRPRRRADEPNPYAIGQRVIKGEIPAEVIAIRGRTCIVAWVMLGKQHTQAVAYAQLRPG